MFRDKQLVLDGLIVQMDGFGTILLTYLKEHFGRNDSLGCRLMRAIERVSPLFKVIMEGKNDVSRISRK